MAKTKDALPRGTALQKPLPATGTVPEAGALFFQAGREKSYRLARAGAIVTLDAGPRLKVALLHATARKLGIDPNNPQG